MNVREEAIDKQRLRCQTLRFFRSSQGFGKAVLIQKCASEFVMAKPGDQELIVVAIILIIAAIAIPNLMRSKIAANEASAVGSVRTINTATATYSSNWGTGYAQDLTSLGFSTASACTATSTNACLIDNVLTSGTNGGYNFVAAGSLGDVGMNRTTASVPR